MLDCVVVWERGEPGEDPKLLHSRGGPLEEDIDYQATRDVDFIAFITRVEEDIEVIIKRLESLTFCFDY